MHYEEHAIPPIAVVAGGYPQLSETFVSREVHWLRTRGVAVCTVGLHPPEKPDHQLPSADITVYDDGLARTLAAAIREMLRSPLSSATTLMHGFADACLAGESTRPASRLKLPLQALVGVGLAGRLRDKRISYIHCHFAHAPTTVGMYAAMQLKIPFGFTGHANDLFHRRVLLKKKLHRASFIAAISHWHARLYEQAVPRSRDKTSVIRCGVDTTQWRSDDSRPASEGPFRLILVARLIDKKGVDTLIRALPEAMRRSPRPLHVTVIGDGPALDRLRVLCRTLDVEDAVEWTGALANDAVRLRLINADAFVLPCKPDSHGDRDGIPVVLIEAMAMGLPVISGDLPAIRELVRPDETGILIEADDVSGLAHSIVRLVSNPDVAHHLGIEGQRWVQEEFELASNVQRLMHAIELVTRGQS